MGGKGGGSSPISVNPPPPTEEEKALQRASTGLLNTGQRQLESASPFRNILTALGTQAATTGTFSPTQLPSLQRQLNIFKQQQAGVRSNLLANLGNSRLLNTPFGQNILANQDTQSALAQLGLTDQAQQQALQLGTTGAGLSGQVGAAASQSGVGGMSSVVQSQANRFGSYLNAQVAQNQLAAQQAGLDSAALGQGIGSLAGLGAAAILFSNPALKTDITPTKDADALKAVRKLPIYRWRYKGDPKMRVGGMTTDMPDDVIVGDLQTRLGYDPVSYLGMLTGAVRALDKQVQQTPRLRKLRRTR